MDRSSPSAVPVPARASSASSGAAPCLIPCQAHGQIIERLVIGAHLVDGPVVALGGAGAGARVERQLGRGAMPDSQPGAVVADGGAAVRLFVAAAGPGADPAALAAAEQARLGVDRVLRAHAGVADGDVVGAGDIAGAEGDIRAQRRADN